MRSLALRSLCVVALMLSASAARGLEWKPRLEMDQMVFPSYVIASASIKRPADDEKDEDKESDADDKDDKDDKGDEEDSERDRMERRRLAQALD